MIRLLVLTLFFSGAFTSCVYKGQMNGRFLLPQQPASNVIEVREFEIFVGGTDDINTYMTFPVAGIDDYGDYDAALQRYFATFLTVPLRAVEVRHHGLREFLRDINDP